jgi:hypothetical protein
MTSSSRPSGKVTHNRDGSTTTTSMTSDGTIVSETTAVDGTKTFQTMGPEGDFSTSTIRPDGTATTEAHDSDGATHLTGLNADGSVTRFDSAADGGSTFQTIRTDPTTGVTTQATDTSRDDGASVHTEVSSDGSLSQTVTDRSDGSVFHEVTQSYDPGSGLHTDETTTGPVEVRSIDDQAIGGSGHSEVQSSPDISDWIDPNNQFSPMPEVGYRGADDSWQGPLDSAAPVLDSDQYRAQAAHDAAVDVDPDVLIADVGMSLVGADGGTLDEAQNFHDPMLETLLATDDA